MQVHTARDGSATRWLTGRPLASVLARVLAGALACAMMVACAPRPGDPAALAGGAGHGAGHGEAASAGAILVSDAEADAAGRAVYDSWCASCHDNAEDSRAVSLESLRRLNEATIRYTLVYGYMKYQSRDVPKDDLERLIKWLPENEEVNDGWINQARCPAKKRKVRLDGAKRSVTNFGFGPENHRSQSAEDAGLTKADMPHLELAWAAAFPQTPTMRSQPVVVGDTIFVAATDAGRVYALDTDLGCVKWMYRSDMTLRSSLTFAEATATSPAALITGDATAKVHAINAETGRELWVTDVKLNELNRITGAPAVHDGKVYAPISAIEVNYTQYDDYECCRGQGAVAALDLATGKQLWVARTMPEATPQLTGRTGTRQWGPSGAIIWSSPAIDAERGVLYAGTGENTSWPATETSDAILAIDLETGAQRWGFQATRADIWNYACSRGGANCDFPDIYHSPDFDFGGSPVLIRTPRGRDLVIAPQKSGVVWALDPNRNGELVWANRIGRGSAGGGVHWGVAYDGARIYAPSNDPPGRHQNPLWGPGLHALNPDTGAIEWSYQPTAADCGEETPAGRAFRPPEAMRMNALAGPIEVQPSDVWAQWTPPEDPETAAFIAQREAAAAAAPPPRRDVRCRLGMSPAALVIDGAVVTGTTGGVLRIFDGATGDILFETNTNRTYEDTTTGVPGQGGSIDSHPYVAADGTLFVQSGYARFGQPPGNMLLAFRPRRDGSAPAGQGAH
ncbi:PQQ-binding-like beta-propeller repeat protein [bacterium]|nr:PQQ-binding-like beta-propeller repeat protein [bacterium]